MIDVVNMYAAGILGMIFIMITIGLLIIIALTVFDIVLQFWYSIKIKRSKRKQI